MLSSILVPLDGSALTERALQYAEALALPSGARVILVRAVPGDQEHGTDSEAEARDYLNGLATRFTERAGAVETAVLRGEAAERIVEEAHRRGSDLIVMATHGRGGLGRWVYGSVAEAVLARASVPTLLVRAWVPEGGATPLADKPKLLVPLDGSHFAEEALPVATELADTLGGELILLRAVARPDVPLGPDALMSPLLKWELDKERGESEDYLQQLAGRFAQEGRTVQTAVRVGRPDMGMAAAVIEATAREHGAALVVMASHRHTGVERLLLGSVADATVRHGTLPVLLVHPQPRQSTDGDD